MSWSYNWARRKNGQIISVIESFAPLTRRLSCYIFWFIIIFYSHYCRRHYCWKFSCKTHQTVWRIWKFTSIKIHKLDNYLDVIHTDWDHVSSFLRPKVYKVSYSFTLRKLVNKFIKHLCDPCACIHLFNYI
jgi:hypothetical protein